MEVVYFIGKPKLRIFMGWGNYLGRIIAGNTQLDLTKF